jgi:hypothetical protein
MNIVQRNIDKLTQLCKHQKVKELYIYGSVLTDHFNDSSDIDILDYFDNYMDFKENLEKLLERLIDLTENQAIHNPVFRKIVDRDKQIIYERSSD